MMSFITDKQTLEDLNLRGKFKTDSVFSLFNQVYTKGGEKLLQEMFTSPLTDPKAINERSLTFQCFQGKSLSFPFTQGELGELEDYVNNSGTNSYLYTYGSLLKDKLLRTLVKDERYDQAERGLKNAIGVLNTVKELLVWFDKEENNPYHNAIESAKAILSDKRLDWLSQERNRTEWSVGKVSGYAHILKQGIGTELKALLDVLYHLDLYMAVGKVAKDNGYGYAEALAKSQNVLQAEDLRHPGIKGAVGNAVWFDGESNLTFLTGANMAGKSTLMKSLGINVYLAHMGFPVGAKKMTFSVKDGLYTSINVSDNLNQGYSHFYAEVMRVKKVAEEVSSGKDLLVIFDELFKGTNVKDAYDATLAVTASFSDYRNCFYVISTHIIEVGEVLQPNYGNMQFRYMPTELEENKPVYPYQARPGISADRHGMLIIQNEGILELLQNDKHDQTGFDLRIEE
jgi:DNA mismatch repair protein MutS